jgi:hypothetical protein
MASIVFIHILLVLYTCTSSILIVNAMTTNYNLRSILFHRNYVQSFIKSDSNSIDDLDTSLSSSNIKRRNVIMPRICYFARVAGTGVRQKLCLPYNDNIRP